MQRDVETIGDLSSQVPEDSMQRDVETIGICIHVLYMYKDEIWKCVRISTSLHYSTKHTKNDYELNIFITISFLFFCCQSTSTTTPSSPSPSPSSTTPSTTTTSPSFFNSSTGHNGCFVCCLCTCQRKSASHSIVFCSCN